MGRTWTEEQKQEASDRYKDKSEVKAPRRTPVNDKRDITCVFDTPEGYKDRWVNDDYGRVGKLKGYGYETVSKANVGSPNADGTHSEQGIVTRDMGKGVTGVLMRQRMDYFLEDQAEKQKLIDKTEASMRKDIKSIEIQNEEDRYGTVVIGK